MISDITGWIVRIPVLLFAITIHEYAHGRIAYALGDPTAKQMGRLSLNPICHIDPLGALSLFLFNFGWAKPVPVNPAYFRDVRKGTILMALAGPMANFLAALVTGILIRYFMFPVLVYQTALIYMLLMNVGLGLFNLIPIPPLDGSHVVENILSPDLARTYHEFGRYGPVIIFGIVILHNFAHTGILNFLLLKPMLIISFLLAGPNFAYLLRILS